MSTADDATCPDCGHPAASHGNWNWPVKCLHMLCDCRINGATVRSLVGTKDGDDDE